MSRCNVCGYCEFGKGPWGRMSQGGAFPACRSCGSLERHRTVRAVWNPLIRLELGRLRAIQFSLDRSVDRDWFRTLEISIYGKRNSLDLENIDRPCDRYDVVICNHILEHIRDDRQAFREIMRILKPTGLFQFTVPLPQSRAVTEDWGYPDHPHGHYRLYGRDLVDRFGEARPDTKFLCVPGADPVTGEPDLVYFAFLDERRLDSIRQKLGTAFPSVEVVA